eukprot:COSAG02_NODE_4378_length_5431_cov_10.940735_2_plen_47_part_00
MPAFTEKNTNTLFRGNLHSFKWYLLTGTDPPKGMALQCNSKDYKAR